MRQEKYHTFMVEIVPAHGRIPHFENHQIRKSLYIQACKYSNYIISFSLIENETREISYIHGWNCSSSWQNSTFWKPPNKEILILYILQAALPWPWATASRPTSPTRSPSLTLVRRCTRGRSWRTLLSTITARTRRAHLCSAPRGPASTTSPSSLNCWPESWGSRIFSLPPVNTRWLLATGVLVVQLVVVGCSSSFFFFFLCYFSSYAPSSSFLLLLFSFCFSPNCQFVCWKSGCHHIGEILVYIKGSGPE